MLTPQEAFKHVQDYAIFFQRSTVDFPSAEESRKLKKGTKFSVFAYLRYEDDTMVGAVSFQDEQPPEDKIREAYTKLAVSLANRVAKASSKIIVATQV